jgi:hypothetical protein
LPIVSGLTEIASQVNNNYIVYNYEKRLKTLEIVDNTKRNLFILEQQPTDYLLDNIIIRSQESFLTNQIKTQQDVSSNLGQRAVVYKELKLISDGINEQQNSLINEIKDRDKKVEELVKKEEELKEEISTLLFFANESEKEKKELEDKVDELNKLLEEKDKKLGTLTEKLDAKTLLKEKEKKELERELFHKLQHSSTNKADVIDALQKDIMENEAYQKNLESENLNLRSKLRNAQAELENANRLKDASELFLKNARIDNEIILGQVFKYKGTEKRLEARNKELEEEKASYIDRQQDLINAKYSFRKQKEDAERLVARKEEEIAEKEKAIADLNKSIQNLQQKNSDKQEEIAKLQKEISDNFSTVNNSELDGRQLYKQGFTNLQTIITETVSLKRKEVYSLTKINKTLGKKRNKKPNHQNLDEAVKDLCSDYKTYVPTTNNIILSTLATPFN